MVTFLQKNILLISDFLLFGESHVQHTVGNAVLRLLRCIFRSCFFFLYVGRLSFAPGVHTAGFVGLPQFDVAAVSVPELWKHPGRNEIRLQLLPGCRHMITEYRNIVRLLGQRMLSQVNVIEGKVLGAVCVLTT